MSGAAALDALIDHEDPTPLFDLHEEVRCFFGKQLFFFFFFFDFFFFFCTACRGFIWCCVQRHLPQNQRDGGIENHFAGRGRII
jgi:hypothetical protein